MKHIITIALLLLNLTIFAQHAEIEIEHKDIKIKRMLDMYKSDASISKTNEYNILVSDHFVSVFKNDKIVHMYYVSFENYGNVYKGTGKQSDKGTTIYYNPRSWVSIITKDQYITYWF